MFKLVIQDDEGKTTVVPLIRDEITIGRKEGNTIRLTERNVSRRHARILRNNGEVQIEDLGSYNGIRVNNARIAERVSLRVSDQVQIGDYKLYLKAEGVEQVDDARTMPIERVNDGQAPTEAMPAVAAPAPTAPVPVQTPPPGLVPAAPPQAAVPTPAAAPLVGNPARTLVAMDNSALHNLAASRPIADPALVAKLTETASYGRLVVISSNFAGKEFELSRPQMIIGRTDDNDIVVNHRSISRNHAKMVREPETNRYTISDLQSSNGVRVNGTDYGKVELRRGDVVDLGHVRLRFIEPGEDFVFSRDAEISDVAEPSTKRGLLVAVVLGVVVLGAIAVYFATRENPSPDPGNQGNSGEHPLGSQSTSNPPAADARVDVATVIDAADTMIASNGDNGTSNPKGSNTTNPNGGTDEAAFGEINSKCATIQRNGEWENLKRCASELSPLNKPKAQEYETRANLEIKANKALDDAKASLASGNAEDALTKLQKGVAGSTSVASQQAYLDAKDRAIQGVKQSIANAAEHNCAQAYTIKNRQTQDVQKVLGAVPCQLASTPQTGSGTTAPSNPCSAANVDAMRNRAQSLFEGNNFGAAETEYEHLMKCDPSALLNVYSAACKAHSFDDAKRFYNRIPGDKARYKQICMQQGFDPEQ